MLTLTLVTVVTSLLPLAHLVNLISLLVLVDTNVKRSIEVNLFSRRYIYVRHTCLNHTRNENM